MINSIDINRAPGFTNFIELLDKVCIKINDFIVGKYYMFIEEETGCYGIYIVGEYIGENETIDINGFKQYEFKDSDGNIKLIHKEYIDLCRYIKRDFYMLLTNLEEFLNNKTIIVKTYNKINTFCTYYNNGLCIYIDSEPYRCVDEEYIFREMR